MITKIADQIENINKSLDWIKKNKPQDYDQKFIQLIELRRTLRKVLSASYNNPGIAAFGKSQVGGMSIVALKLYFNKRNKVKLEIALAKGKNLHDKRETLKEKIQNREITQTLKEFQRR